MTIVSGIGEALYVNQFDLSGDVGAFSSITRNVNLEDITTIKKPAVARQRLLKDGSISFQAFFDVAAGGSIPVLGIALPGVSANWTWTMADTLGARTASLVAIEADFPISRGQDGSATLSPTAQGNGYGSEWGRLLTVGKQTFASSGSGTALDNAASTAFGLTGYLHVMSIGSGTATVAIQDSSDNISFSNVTGGVFTNVTTATSQRIQTATNLTVARYVRINVTNTFTNLVAVLSFIRYASNPNT